MKFRHGAAVLASLSVLATCASAERIFAVDSRALLVTFDSEKPETLTSMMVIRGLAAGRGDCGDRLSADE